MREEALRTWVGVNYLLRTLGGEWHGTVAVLYVGRAHSAWVVYALDPEQFGTGTRRSSKEHPELVNHLDKMEYVSVLGAQYTVVVVHLDGAPPNPTPRRRAAIHGEVEVSWSSSSGMLTD